MNTKISDVSANALWRVSLAYAAGSVCPSGILLTALVTSLCILCGSIYHKGHKKYTKSTKKNVRLLTCTVSITRTPAGFPVAMLFLLQ